jgi:hypothetical protein
LRIRSFSSGGMLRIVLSFDIVPFLGIRTAFVGDVIAYGLAHDIK